MKWLLALIPAIGWADSFSLGAGKLLNNATTARPGYMLDLTYTHPLEKGDVQLSVTQVEKDLISDHTLNVTLSFIAHYHDFSGGPGLIISQTYSLPQWWIDNQGKQAWGKNGQCSFCGLAVQMGYDITPRLQLQARYWSTQYYIIPPQNGLMLLFSYRIL